EVAPGYAGTLGEIARKVHDGTARFGWLPVPVPTVDSPLTTAEASELLRLLAAQTPERADRVNQRVVDVEAYPGADEVRGMMTAESSAREAAAQGSTETSQHLAGISADVLKALQSSVDKARGATTRLGLDVDATAWPATDWAGRAIA